MHWRLTPVRQELSGIGLVVQLVNLLSQNYFEADRVTTFYHRRISISEFVAEKLPHLRSLSVSVRFQAYQEAKFNLVHCAAKTGACCCPVFIAFIQAACRFSGRAATQQHERDDDASVACLLEAVNHVP